MPVVPGRRRVVLGLALSASIVLAAVGVSVAQRTADVAPLVRVEWEAVHERWDRPRLVGHVYNDSVYKIGSIRLRLESLDTANQVIGQTLAWTHVSVPARGRAYFSLPRPPGAESLRVTVESFVLIAREVDESP